MKSSLFYPKSCEFRMVGDLCGGRKASDPGPYIRRNGQSNPMATWSWEQSAEFRFSAHGTMSLYVHARPFSCFIGLLIGNMSPCGWTLKKYINISFLMMLSLLLSGYFQELKVMPFSNFLKDMLSWGSKLLFFIIVPQNTKYKFLSLVYILQVWVFNT